MESKNKKRRISEKAIERNSNYVAILNTDGSISVGQLWNNSLYEKLIRVMEGVCGLNALPKSMEIITSNTPNMFRFEVFDIERFELENIQAIQILSNLDIIKAIENSVNAQKILKLVDLPT